MKVLTRGNLSRRLKHNYNVFTILIYVLIMKYEEDERVSLTQQTRLVRFLFVGQFLSGSCHEETAPRALGPTDTEPRRLEEPFQVFVVELHHWASVSRLQGCKQYNLITHSSTNLFWDTGLSPEKKDVHCTGCQFYLAPLPIYLSYLSSLLR